MEFSVKGIQFNKEQLVNLPLDELHENSISRHHIFHLLSNGRRCVLLVRAGEIIKKEFLDKYKSKGGEFFSVLTVAHEEDIGQYKLLWQELQNAKTQKKQLEIREKIYHKFLKDNLEKSEKSLLPFIISCFEQMYHLPMEFVLNYQDISHLLFTRGLLLGSFSLLTVMGQGICDYEFLKDFFHITLFMDYGLIENGILNYMMCMASEAERMNAGHGLRLLYEKKRPQTESEKFKNHPTKSFEKINTFKELFTYPEIIQFIKYHHEKVDGTGFPNGYYYSSLGETETILHFCDNFIPFEEHIFNLNDGEIFFTSYFESLALIKKNGVLPLGRTYGIWQSLLKWGKSQSEVAS